MRPSTRVPEVCMTKASMLARIGDYDVIFSSSDVAASDPACGSLGAAINGHIHVD